MDNERLTIWMNFTKFLLGTFALGLVATILNNEIQDREIELKELEQLGQFIDYALTEDVGVRKRFAQYFSKVTRSDKLRERWSDYHSIVDQEYQHTISEKENIKEKLAVPELPKQQRIMLEEQVFQLDKTLSPVPYRVDENLKQAQSMLHYLGYDVRYIDGVYGPRTADTIKKFQANQGLEQNGRLDPQTLSRIKNRYNEKRSPNL